MALDYVLIVDDERAVWSALKRLVNRNLKPKEIVTAESMEEALGQTNGTKYDMTILDGLYGECFPLHDALREQGQEGPIVLYTSDRAVLKEAEKRGIPKFMKPFHEELMDYLKEVKDQ